MDMNPEPAIACMHVDSVKPNVLTGTHLQTSVECTLVSRALRRKFYFKRVRKLASRSAPDRLQFFGWDTNWKGTKKKRVIGVTLPRSADALPYFPEFRLSS